MTVKFDRALKGLAMIAAAWFALAAPEQAVAQRCPSGIPSQGNPACIPPEVYHGTGSSGESAPVDSSPPLLLRWKTAYAALVWHPDATEVWAVWNASESVEATERMALDACNRVMREGCKVAVSSTGGTIAFGHGPDGYLRAVWGDKKRDAIKELDNQCASSGVSCRLWETITATHWQEAAVSVTLDKTVAYLPETRGEARYGAVASLSEAEAKGTDWVGHAWLVTGESTYAAATDKALARCRAATGLQCEIDTHGVNSNILRYSIGTDGMAAWSMALTRKDAETSVKQKCKQRFKGKKCSVVAFYDTKAPRDEMIVF